MSNLKHCTLSLGLCLKVLRLLLRNTYCTRLHIFVGIVHFFDCLRGRYEFTNMLIGEFTVLPCKQNTLFQMKRDFKSCQPDTRMKIVHKPALENVFTPHRPSNLKQHSTYRLLLCSRDNAQPNYAVWYDRTITRCDCFLLRENASRQKFTNSLLRKFQLEKFVDANAPVNHWEIVHFSWKCTGNRRLQKLFLERGRSIFLQKYLLRHQVLTHHIKP